MKRIPYLHFDYKNTFRRDWLLCADDQGCTPLPSGLPLRMEKSPPPLPEPVTEGRAKAVAAAVKPSATAAPALPPPPKKDGATAFLEWMIERRDKKLTQRETAQAAQAPKPPKPLDIYELPAAMRAFSLPPSCASNG